MTGLLSSCTLVGQPSAGMSHHSRVRQSGGSQVQTITFAAQIKPSHLVVEHSDMCCISTELFSQNSFSQTSQNGSAYMHGSNSNYTGLKQNSLQAHDWRNQVVCVFTVAPTFTSGSHWSQNCSRTSAGRANCASVFFFFGNLTLHLQHDAKTAPF